MSRLVNAIRKLALAKRTTGKGDRLSLLKGASEIIAEMVDDYIEDPDAFEEQYTDNEAEIEFDDLDDDPDEEFEDEPDELEDVLASVITGEEVVSSLESDEDDDDDDEDLEDDSDDDDDDEDEDLEDASDDDEVTASSDISSKLLTLAPFAIKTAKALTDEIFIGNSKQEGITTAVYEDSDSDVVYINLTCEGEKLNASTVSGKNMWSVNAVSNGIKKGLKVHKNRKLRDEAFSFVLEKMKVIFQGLFDHSAEGSTDVHDWNSDYFRSVREVATNIMRNRLGRFVDTSHLDTLDDWETFVFDLKNGIYDMGSSEPAPPIDDTMVDESVPENPVVVSPDNQRVIAIANKLVSSKDPKDRELGKTIVKRLRK